MPFSLLKGNKSDSSPCISIFVHFHSFAFISNFEDKTLLTHFNCMLQVLVETLSEGQIIYQKRLRRKNREEGDILHLLQAVLAPFLRDTSQRADSTHLCKFYLHLLSKTVFRFHCRHLIWRACRCSLSWASVPVFDAASCQLPKAIPNKYHSNHNICWDSI